jgi:hypothetical protein
MVPNQSSGQQYNQYQYNDQSAVQYQQPGGVQYQGQGYQQQGYPQQYYPQQQPYQAYGQPVAQQAYYPPKPAPIQPNPLKKFLPVIIICGILLVALVAIGIVFNPSNATGGKGNVIFKNFKINYNKVSSGYLSYLDTISVVGNVTNTGTKDIQFSKVKFICTGAFLVHAYSSTLEYDVLVFNDTVLSPGETAAFSSQLGKVTDSVPADQMSSPFGVYEGNNLGGAFSINVGPYYK